MLPKPSPVASPSCRAAEITRALDGVSGADDAEVSFINHGDDILDVVIGMQQTARNRFLFGAMPLPVRVWDGPAVAVGSGPSLDDAFPRLRDIQHSTLIVAAHSAVRRLLEADIVPHVITPKERDPSCGLVPPDLPDSVIYGGLPCVPTDPGRCKRHWLVGSCDHFIAWLGHERNIAMPLTSGTLGVWVACNLSTGPVHLIGHDMTMGHFSGFNLPEEQAGGTIACLDGQERPSCLLYRRARDELASLAAAFPLIQCSPQGAAIPGAAGGWLPNRTDTKVSLPTYDAPDHAALAAVNARLAMIPEIMQTAETLMDLATTPDDLSAKALFGEHERLGAAVFQTIYLSMSVLRRTQNWTMAETFDATRDALMQSASHLRRAWQDIAHAA